MKKPSLREEKAMDDLISIVVPVYNAESTLQRCVDSLRKQSYQNLQIILVNDGSKDDSLALCRAFAQQDARIQVIDKPNGGVSSARNAGLDAAIGYYVMFCDSDDWVDINWCKEMKENHMPEDLTMCRIARSDLFSEGKAEVAAVEVANRSAFLHYPLLMCSPVNKIYTRSIIEQNHLRFTEELRLGEDFAFVLSYVCGIQGKIRILNQELYYYDVTTEGSLSKRSQTMEQCDLFYHKVTSAMKEIGALDAESIYNRDWFVMKQFESMLIETAENKQLSFREKMKTAKCVGQLNSFSDCDGGVIRWGNPVYLWLFRKKHTRLIILFLMLRVYLRKKQ